MINYKEQNKNILQSQIVTALNDRLRKYGIGGRIVMTQGIAALQQTEIYDIVQAIRSFDSFTEENDPHAEHDFGFVQIAQHSVFWKIDYYDESLSMHSPDKADPNVTVRVMTIMLADEY
ncbi:DUF3768 domain-containing protein [Brucella tritici]|uniref:DUF3768 domain-containing protein n=1 Tax=Brucella tritici TaxID=94626 RepID=A0A7V7VVV6_9HYPH|nr:DUF3768 domain-containing protein [Brucella tritici]KAB2657815.1 DUF3768 domain-containing protein [Brucella tritici]